VTQRLRGDADIVQNRTHRLNQIYKNCTFHRPPHILVFHILTPGWLSLLQWRKLFYPERCDLPFQDKRKCFNMWWLKCQKWKWTRFVNTQGDKYITNTRHSLPSYHLRNNYDNFTNKSGKSLLQLCQSLGLDIVNGRMRGDSGCYTLNSFLGNSNLDYFIITDIDQVHLRAFTVSPQTSKTNSKQ